MPTRRWRQLTSAAGLCAICLWLTACLGDGVHVGQTGLFYSAGAAGPETCEYGSVPPGTEPPDTAAVESERHMQLAVETAQAPPGTGGRYLQLDSDDGGFATDGCEHWIPAAMLNPVVADDQDVPAGMFRVGHDIQPGDYTSAGGEGCQWYRLSDAGVRPSVLDQGGGPGATTVTIEASDAFFLTRYCAPFTTKLDR